jgi:putative lipoprotein
VLILAVTAWVLGAAPRDAWARDPDPWFGEDKLLHFSASAVAAGLGYGVSSVFVEPRRTRALIGATTALSLGIGKELYDATGRGDPSFRDLTWDVIGTAVGVSLSLGLDLLLARATSASASSGGKGLVVHF